MTDSIYPEIAGKTNHAGLPWLPRGPVYGGFPDEGRPEEVIPTSSSEYERRLSAYEQQVEGLLEQVKELEQVVVDLRR